MRQFGVPRSGLGGALTAGVAWHQQQQEKQRQPSTNAAGSGFSEGKEDVVGRAGRHRSGTGSNAGSNAGSGSAVYMKLLKSAPLTRLTNAFEEVGDLVRLCCCC